LFGATGPFYSRNSRSKARLFEALGRAEGAYSDDHGPARAACAVRTRA